ncbi:DNA polymerase III subunit delta' [Luteimonas soli]|uniref:DNA-directed DNA polymerase n=1 Tax=Luteimonas soli TaxID=1648966 RepID=A0ABV7XQH9_9GAMM
MDAPTGLAAFAPWQRRAYERARAAMDNGRLGHALLLCGPERLGKRAVAEALAQYALCTDKGAGGAPCGGCRSCRLFGARAQRDPVEVRPDGSLAHPDGHSSHPDLLLVGYEWKLRPSPAKPRTEIVIDQMRELSARLGLSSESESGTRVAIVEPADAVNYHAWNAILKTLEEPQPGRYLWLVVSNPARLPATIRSRCQRLEVPLPPRDEARAWLQAQGHAPKVADEALEAARGHPGLADAWLQDGGIALRREVAADLVKLGRGELGAVETAQRWTSGGDAAMRLRHAADLVLAEAEAAGLTEPARIRKLAAWFDAANRTRELLQTTVRADLAVAELLLAWRGDGGAITQARGRA